ncbi:CRTAC1 family protein [Streptomyces sedi]|uniref:CRTAC1 family protein n=1 Tax=Streptomyces sedi TaxID=555059 RepID=A0A5C4VFC7_9ACTN|nr:CRTAC1 family protein [Streptomyces sedi]TNM34637.1 CRTAC1 family protein [Streptomyces sedi]
MTSLFFLARLPEVSAATQREMAERYEFTEMEIAMPPGYQADQTVREVNPAFHHIRSWISSVGASVALNDLQGTGNPDDLCIVDPRSDEIVVTYAPTAPEEGRFTPFLLDQGELPMDDSMAPMGCTPGDFNGDGRMDLLTTYWGRTPVVFVARSDAEELSNDAYRPVELIPQESFDGGYHGARWNTNAVNVADYDGDGHPDILIANYFPDSDVLDSDGVDNVEMNNSLSNAKNGGGAHLLRFHDATSGPDPTLEYVEVPGAIPQEDATGWTLAISSADLTGDGLPEMYIANDFGKDHLLHNVSDADGIRFETALGERSWSDPKSFVLGYSSFKGMGIDFGDLDNNGSFDMMVSNITSAWGLEESNFAFVNQADSEAEMADSLAGGTAPFTQDAYDLGLAFTGWGWDVKMGDFLNSGNLEIVQTEGFVKGEINRWPWLQEMAMTNDNLFTDPAMWPKMQPGDDLAGGDPMAFYARESEGERFANLNGELGLDEAIPSRGVAMADTRGNGALDFAVARQWGAPVFFANNAPELGNVLDLDLYRPHAEGAADGGMRLAGQPAYEATVRIETPDGHTQVNRLDGGGGHSGKRSFEVRFGLGEYDGPVSAQLRWRDVSGEYREETLELTPGSHSLLLHETAEEVTGS